MVFFAFNLSNNSSIWKTISCDNKYQEFLACPRFFFIFWKNLFPMGKRKSNIINISVFLLPCLQLWRQNSAGRCVLLPPLVEVRWPQWEVLQPSLCIESSSREMDKNCPQVLTHCPIHPPAKGIHSDLC